MRRTQHYPFSGGVLAPCSGKLIKSGIKNKPGRNGRDVSGPVRSVQRSGRFGVGELLDGGGDPAPGRRAVVILRPCKFIQRERRFPRSPSRRSASASGWRRARYRSRVSRRKNRTLAVDRRLTPIIAWRAKLRVKVAIDARNINRRGCRPAHCRRMCLCRRAWRRRHPAGAGGLDRAAVWRAIPGGAASAAASIGKTAAPTLSGHWRVGFLFAPNFCNSQAVEPIGPGRIVKSVETAMSAI